MTLDAVLLIVFSLAIGSVFFRFASVQGIPRWIHLLYFLPVTFAFLESNILRSFSLIFVTTFLVWASFIDVRTRLVYDVHTLCISILGGVPSIILFGWKFSLLGMFIGLLFGLWMKGIGRILLGKEGKELDYGFGDGDFLLIIALGASLGLQIIPFFLWTLVASFAVSMLLMATKRVKRTDTIPFVPYIALAFFLVTILDPNMKPLQDFFLYVLGS